MEFNAEPVVWTLRFYPDGGGYPGPFVGVCTVQAIGPKSLFVSAAHGTITRQHIYCAANYFYNLGFRFVLMNRHGKVIQRKLERFTGKKKPSEEGFKGH